MCRLGWVCKPVRGSGSTSPGPSGRGRETVLAPQESRDSPVSDSSQAGAHAGPKYTAIVPRPPPLDALAGGFGLQTLTIQQHDALAVDAYQPGISEGA